MAKFFKLSCQIMVSLVTPVPSPTSLPSGQARHSRVNYGEWKQIHHLRLLSKNCPMPLIWWTCIYIINKHFCSSFWIKISSLCWLRYLLLSVYQILTFTELWKSWKKKKKTILGKPILSRISKTSSKPCDFFLSCLFIRFGWKLLCFALIPCFVLITLEYQ